MTATIAPYRSSIDAGRDGFASALHAEWTKFRTVRGWTIAAVAAALIIVLFGLLTASGSHADGLPSVPTGPGGGAVTDEFYLAGQSLAGDGTITARIASLTGSVGGNSGPAGAPAPATGAPAPWAKAGLIIKQNTKPGSPYAAVMVTGGHGVRLQHDYTGDIAGPSGPSWLRLTRHGGVVTAYASADGTTWTTVGAVHPSALAGTVQIGMFVTSPPTLKVDEHLGGGKDTGSGTVATAGFDHVSLTGAGAAGAWTGTSVGADAQHGGPGAFQPNGAGYALTGSGDIAPGNHAAGSFDQVFAGGTFAALAVLTVLGVLVMTSEYRRGLIRTSLTVSPRRGRVLAARALVLAAVAFAAGLIGAVVVAPIGMHVLRANGNVIAPVSTLTAARVIVGLAAVLAVGAVLGLAVGTILRRGAAAVAPVIVLAVLPYLLATAGALPVGAAQWLLRVTPAAAFAVEQSIPAYPQVEQAYDPMHGYFPLAPWAGFAVLCAWTAVALAAAAYLLRKRDV
jgi:ABC-type transport system involved in multi-copper enzyme maturation permease subunit